MKVSELSGAELDWYVAKAEGIENVELRTAQRATNRICVVLASGGRQFDYTYSPSTQWNCGGPIIERERIRVEGYHNIWRSPSWLWTAWPDAQGKNLTGANANGRSHESFLVAAMRAYVASVFGEEVEDI